MKTTRQHIEDNVSDMVVKFLYYDRKEDQDLPRGAIEQAIRNGEISVQDIVTQFAEELQRGIDR